MCDARIVSKVLRLWLLTLFLVVAPAIGTEAAPFAFVSNSANGVAYVIDTASQTATPVLSFKNMTPRGIAITPDGAFAYVPITIFHDPDPIAAAVLVVDLSTHQVITTIPLGSGTGDYVAITPF